jgi:hypothetical protein
MGEGIGGIIIEHLRLRGSHFHPCGASLYRTLKLELKLELDHDHDAIMMGVTSTWRSCQWSSKRYRDRESTNIGERSERIALRAVPRCLLMRSGDVAKRKAPKLERANHVICLTPHLILCHTSQLRTAKVTTQQETWLPRRAAKTHGEDSKKPFKPYPTVVARDHDL